MTTTVVPYIEVARLLKLVLDHYEFQYQVKIPILSVTYILIPPATGYRLGMQIASATQGSTFKIHLYMNFDFESEISLSAYRPEEVGGGAIANSVADIRFVCYAELPMFMFPALSKIRLTATLPSPPTPPSPTPPSPTPTPVGTLPTLGFVAQSYNVSSGNVVTPQVSLNVPSTVSVTANYSVVSGTALADVDFLSNSGTITFTPGQVLSNDIQIPTGYPYYYYWVPVIEPGDNELFLEDYSFSASTDGTFIGVFNLSQFFSQINLSTKIRKPSAGQTNYHEFKFDIPNYEQFFSFSISIKKINLLTQEEEIDQYTLNFIPNNGLYDLILTISAYQNDSVIIPVLLPSSVSSPINAGFFIDSTFAVLGYVAGNWIDLTTGVANSSYAATAFTEPISASLFECNAFITTRSNMQPLGDVRNGFVTIALIGPDITANAVGSEPFQRSFSATNGGNFMVTLSQPVAATLRNTSTAVNISSAILCYPKLITDDNTSGFIEDDSIRLDEIIPPEQTN